MKKGGVNVYSTPWMRKHLHGEDITVEGMKAVYEPKSTGFWGEPAELYIQDWQGEEFFQVKRDEWEKKLGVVRFLRYSSPGREQI